MRTQPCPNCGQTSFIVSTTGAVVCRLCLMVLGREPETFTATPQQKPKVPR